MSECVCVFAFCSLAKCFCCSRMLYFIPHATVRNPPNRRKSVWVVNRSIYRIKLRENEKLVFGRNCHWVHQTCCKKLFYNKLFSISCWPSLFFSFLFPFFTSVQFLACLKWISVWAARRWTEPLEHKTIFQHRVWASYNWHTHYELACIFINFLDENVFGTQIKLMIVSVCMCVCVPCVFENMTIIDFQMERWKGSERVRESVQFLFMCFIV